MPRGDMTGPPGGGGKGSGAGGGAGRGRGMDRGGMGGGRMGGNRSGAGPGGECVCPKCGARVPHQAGMPCYKVSCLKCGTTMARA